MFGLDGKVALVTGSTRGLGRAIAQAFASQGAHVIVTGRSLDDVDDVAGAIRGAGGQASGIAADLADAAAGVELVESVVADHGRIDVLVNNAGVNHKAPLADFADDEWDRVVRVNLSTPFAMARAASIPMIQQGHGRIITTASIMGVEVARPTIPAYVSTKAGVMGLTKALAVELGPHGITVNAIGPGYVVTDINRSLAEDPEFNQMIVDKTPARRWGDPAEIGAAAVFLASDEASYVNGQTIIVDGGMTSAL